MLREIWRWFIGKPAVVEGYDQEEMDTALGLIRFWREEADKLRAAREARRG